MFKVPFGWMPGHWGLKGKTRDIAKAEYELSGFDLEIKLLELENLPQDQHDRKFIELNRKHGKITDEVANRQLVHLLIEDPVKRDLALLELDWREKKITELEYQKKTATLRKEPWVTVINMDFSKGSSLEGSFELDWNEFFVDKLKVEGYTGPTPDNIVNQWFMEVCRNVAMEEFDGTGDFAADSEANLETFKKWSTESESLSKGRRGYR